MLRFLMSTVAVSIVLLTGCNNAKSPDAVEKDVATAEQKAAAEVSKSEQKASNDLGKAADKVDDKVVAFNNTAAKDAYDLAVAKADGDRKVALANCSAARGDDQKRCKDQADADYNAVKANAKAAAQSEKQ
jgi:ABC-type enterochelin transport system substrate-binding protein